MKNLRGTAFLAFLSNFLSGRTVGILAMVTMLIGAGVAQASTLWVGHDITSPVERIDSTTGVSLGYWGATGATGTALDGAGHVYTVVPSGLLSVITQYDDVQTPVGTINFNSGIENGNGFPSWIEDMAYDGGGRLWVSGYNGIVYNIDSFGTVLSSFDTGSTFTGVAFDGTYLYTNEGFYGGGNLYQRELDGTIVSTITTGFAGGAGLGYDATDNTLWVGYLAGTNDIRQFDISGNLLSSLSIGGSYHDGLEVGELYATVPEASTLLLLGSGLAGLIGLRKKLKA